MQKCCHAEPVEADNCIILNTLYELLTLDYELQITTNLRIIDIGHEIKKRTLFKMR